MVYAGDVVYRKALAKSLFLGCTLSKPSKWHPVYLFEPRKHQLYRFESISLTCTLVWGCDLHNFGELSASREYSGELACRNSWLYDLFSRSANMDRKGTPHVLDLSHMSEAANCPRKGHPTYVPTVDGGSADDVISTRRR